MKKSIIAVLVCALLLCGCKGGSSDKDSSAQGESSQGAQGDSKQDQQDSSQGVLELPMYPVE